MNFSAVTGVITGAMRKVLPLKYCGAVIVAAGTASRMGGIDKVMAELEGEPMILRTVRTFASLDAIKEIVIVTREDLVEPIKKLTAEIEKVVAVVVGGASRQESVSLGLDALTKKVELAAIQDGARPLITCGHRPYRPGCPQLWRGSACHPCQGYHQGCHRRCGQLHA